MSIMIVDYGMGNIFSVKKMLDMLGVTSFISNNPSDILKADKIILPGVGSFKMAMENLEKYNLIGVLNEARLNKTPILGICLGMQLMANYSYEGGKVEGLGWINGVVDVLIPDGGLRVPHIGWNNVKLLDKNLLFNSFLGEPTFYFSHSYAIRYDKQSEVIAVCDYGQIFPVAIQSNNIFGTQFHPEKSQLNGRILLENFLSWGG